MFFFAKTSKTLSDSHYIILVMLQAVCTFARMVTHRCKRNGDGRDLGISHQDCQCGTLSIIALKKDLGIKPLVPNVADLE